MTAAGTIVNSCANCRHHRKERRDEIKDMVFDTVAELEDKQVYLCAAPEGTYAGRQIGDLPTICSSWAQAKDPTPALKAADDLVARAMARLASRKSPTGEGHE